MPLYKQPGSPYWYVRIGRKTRISSRTTNKEEAKEFERTLEQRKWREEQLGDRSSIAWSEVAERWLNRDARPKGIDRRLLKWLAPHIAGYSVRDVADIDNLERLRKLGLGDGWSHSTVDRMMATVSAVLHAAVRWKILTTGLPDFPMYRPVLNEPRFLSPPELDRLCGKLPLHLGLAARFAVLTLLRMRAMTGLTWERVDLQRRVAWIPRAHQKANRTFRVELSDEAVSILVQLRQFQVDQYQTHLKVCKRRGRAVNPKWNRTHVFTFQGYKVDACNTATFKQAVEAAGVGPLRWHDLRHTGASWAIQNGVTLKELMELGDWRSLNMVLRYTHLAPGGVATAAQKVANLWHSAQKEKSQNRSKTA